MPGHDLIIYQFSRLRVEQGDFSDFLRRFAAPRLPAGPKLKAMMGRMLFCIEGYDVDPREIYLIPEVRRFYAAFHSAWPYWLYFCDLNQDGLNAMAVCCLNSFASITRDGQIRCGVEYDPLELVRFIGQDFSHMNLMCERAGLSEADIYERTRQVFKYFQLPLGDE